MSAGSETPAKRRRSYRNESLASADLVGVDLRDVVFEHVDLTGANLRGACLDGAILRHCDLSGADLSLALLRRTSLALVELRRTNLAHCDLRLSNWTSCIAEEADFLSAKLDRAAFIACRFDGADFTRASLLQTNTLHSVFSRARFDQARKFAWSREIVVEILARAADDLEGSKYVGAIALHQDWCYEKWRSILINAPRYRSLALKILSAYPDSDFAAAMHGQKPSTSPDNDP